MRMPKRFGYPKVPDPDATLRVWGARPPDEGSPYADLVLAINMQLKRDSTADFVKALQEIEDRSNLCFDKLRIYHAPRGRASWAVLVSLVLKTELERQKEGFKNYDVKLINLSRRGSIVLRWIRERGDASESNSQSYSWNIPLAEAVDEAISVAGNYDSFLSSFPMWHRDRVLAELPADSTVRFTVPGGAPARRVSAFHKGFRPVVEPIRDEGLVLTAEQTRERDAVVSRCFFSGHLSMAYPEPLALYRLLLPAYLNRLNALFRRCDSIDLGEFTLGELRCGYAALSTIFSVHEDLCFRFGIRHEYPVNSCVMMRTPQEWSRLVSMVSNLDETKCAAIVEDLTLRDRFWDLHVQPFISVDESMLAVAPQFPLHSRPDENTLRVCGHRRRSHFDEASQLKEQEMLEDLLPECPKRFCPRPRIPLQSGLPNIDLLLADEDSLAVVVAELKWLRKPFGWLERIERDEDFNKGLRQLANVRAFLADNPTFLSARGKLKRRLDKYTDVAFVLVARDHFSWSEGNDFIVTDYDVFKKSLSQNGNLCELIRDLRTYDWLPVEGKHFQVRFDRATANGVTVESEVFYRIP